MPQVVVAVVVLALLPFAGRQLPLTAGFLPAVLSLVGCFELICAGLLASRFVARGDPRLVALATAYLTSAVILAGYAAAFPGVLGDRPPLGADPSTSAWLWVAWHALFPVLLAVALAPWPRRLQGPVAVHRRLRTMWLTTAGCVVVGVAVVGVIVIVAGDLPTIVNGLDTSRRGRTVGPGLLPAVAVATATVVAVAWRRRGVERWAALAATTALADVVLTLQAGHRFSVGWYAGRTMTVVSAGVVVAALLAESVNATSRLAEEGERLRAALERSDALERLHHTLLTTMADGVIMQRPSGEVIASNPAARELLGLDPDRLGHVAFDPSWQLLDAEGRPRSANLAEHTLLTGAPTHDEVMGVERDGGSVRWMSVNTVATRDGRGALDCTISSMTDITCRHAAQLSFRRAFEDTRERIVDVLRDGRLAMVFQPIVSLRTGDVAGTEALARFAGTPPRTPDRWFADAAGVGLGTELELAAIRTALAEFDRLPAGIYLSVNASPSTVTSPELTPLLCGVPLDRLVLELTEHVGVDDYTALGTALEPLRRRGLRVAVDDAGAGFASMRHILNLHPDVIKLDVALTRGLHADRARRALVAALLGFAVEIGAQIVAEGIETPEELAILQRLGIKHGQGYLLGRPAPLPLPVHAAAWTPGDDAWAGAAART